MTSEENSKAEYTPAYSEMLRRVERHNSQCISVGFHLCVVGSTSPCQQIGGEIKRSSLRVVCNTGDSDQVLQGG